MPKVYVNYVPSIECSGQQHQERVIESASLACTKQTQVKYQSRIPPDVYESGKLSQLQIEAIILAGDRHETRLENNHRAGIIIGDGKGRTAAGVILDNHLQGRTESVWITSTAALEHDVKRDLADIGASQIKIYNLAKTKYAKLNSPENCSIAKGLIFLTDYHRQETEAGGATR